MNHTKWYIKGSLNSILSVRFQSNLWKQIIKGDGNNLVFIEMPRGE